MAAEGAGVPGGPPLPSRASPPPPSPEEGNCFWAPFSRSRGLGQLLASAAPDGIRVTMQARLRQLMEHHPVHQPQTAEAISVRRALLLQQSADLWMRMDCL